MAASIFMSTLKIMFGQISKHFEVTLLHVVFSTLFSVFRRVVKQGLSCLMYEVNYLSIQGVLKLLITTAAIDEAWRIQ